MSFGAPSLSSASGIAGTAARASERSEASEASPPSSRRAPPPPAPPPAPAWERFTGGNPRLEVKIERFSTPFMNSSGLVDFRWAQPGDAIPFELTARVQGDPEQVRAEVWTNANHSAEPDAFEALPMAISRREGDRVTYRVEVPVDRIGNFRAVGRISIDGGRTHRWMSEAGLQDVRFRPHDVRHDALDMAELNVGLANFDPKTGRYGTFADLLEPGSPLTNGRYTLEWLASQGVTAVWLQPCFEIEKWDRRHPTDDAGSPYAVKDYFAVRRELSRAARGKAGADAEHAAREEFQAFTRRADELGIKVILDVALNHVGHNYEFEDLFVRYDQAGHETRELRRNDFSQVADAAQLATIEARLRNPEVLKYMEYLAPHLYGRYPDTRGAEHVSQIAPGGWFEWPDTKQLNHGRMRWSYTWWDPAASEENRRVQGWLTRILSFWAVEMGVDGFRLDYTTGLPQSFLERALNLVQADVDRHRPGKNLFLLGEDFHTTQETRHWLDAGQGGWFHEFLAARRPEQFERIVESPWFHDLLSLGSHDEERYIHALGGDRRAAARLWTILELLGGPVLHVMGDEFGEGEKLPFKQYRGVASLRGASAEAARIADARGRAARLRQVLPALAGTRRSWLRPRDGGAEGDLLALARLPAPGAPGSPVLVFANLHNGEVRENVFRVNEDLARSIDPLRRYQVRDRLADHPAALWDPPLTGKEILERGIFCRLAPYQVQALALEPI
jgi:hypothetical protein